ncbi:MAG: DUF1573 domain-containing protein [Verrucomicrobiae bacterium]|nr:DUF1573 domain-containing protein [Verrucomicrobiae bacterium]
MFWISFYRLGLRRRQDATGCRKRWLPWLAAGFFLLGMADARAQIRWDKRELEFEPAVTESRVIAHFTFTNSGNKPVRILSVKSSCGCTSLVQEKVLYQPGERGEITADFHFGQRTGWQRQSIVARTDDPAEPDVLLKFRVKIPELIRVSPGFVYWLTGEEPRTKEMSLKVVCSQPVRILKVTSNNDQILARWTEIKPGREYAIKVTPRQTKEPVGALIGVETDFPADHPRGLLLFANVKN